jgi:protein-tyrosine phosphatase
LPDEIAAFKRERIDILVSALAREEADDLGLAEESKCCAVQQIEFISFPIVDRSTPPSTVLLEVAEKLKSHLSQGRNVGIHCRASIGRASLIAAAVLGRFGVP